MDACGIHLQREGEIGFKGKGMRRVPANGQIRGKQSQLSEVWYQLEALQDGGNREGKVSIGERVDTDIAWVINRRKRGGCNNNAAARFRR